MYHPVYSAIFVAVRTSQITFIDYRTLAPGTAGALEALPEPTSEELADAIATRVASRLQTTPKLEEYVTELLRAFLLANPDVINLLKPILED